MVTRPADSTPSDADDPLLPLQQRRRVLDRALAALTGQVSELVDAARSSNADDEHDPEGATLAFEREQVNSLIARVRSDQAETEAAIVRVHEGRYGVCLECGRQIGSERLLARPAATTCVSCASSPRR